MVEEGTAVVDAKAGEAKAVETKPELKGFDFRSLVQDDGRFVEKWHEQLPEDARKAIGDNKHLTNIKHPVQLAQEVVELSKFKGRALVPKPDAPAEEWDKVFQAAGIPDKEDGYKLVFEGLTDEQNKLLTDHEIVPTLQRMFKMAGVPLPLANKVAGAYAQGFLAKAEAWRGMVATAQKDLDARWGAGKAFNAGMAETAREKFASESLRELLTQVGIADHPAVIEHFHAIQQRIVPGKIVTNAPAQGGAAGGESIAKSLGLVP